MKRFVFAGRLCLDFARTLKARRSLASEGVATPDDLAAWIIEADIGLRLGKKDADVTGVFEARRLREAIYEAVSKTALGGRPRGKGIACINEFAAREPPVLQLEGRPFRRVARAADPLTAALSAIARDAIDLVTSPEIHRVRECANPQCTALFLDTSRPGRRRWCAMETCGNLAKVRRYRARRREPARRHA